MIKANELRIGNWVRRLTATNFLQVEMIDSSGTIKFEGLDGHVFDLEGQNIEPISLTSALLKKCDLKGFHFEIFGDNERGFHIAFENEDWLFLKYLHQLQNLYFALTGEELPININHAQQGN